MAGRQALTREAVLEEALALVDAEGLDALSMRRLGQRLGVEAMTLYYYVPSKEALHDGLVEAFLAGVHSTAEAWRDAVTQIALEFRAAARRHPEVMRLFATRTLHAPAWARATESLLAAFLDEGFGRVEAVHAYRLVSAYMTGYVLGELRLVGAPTLAAYLRQLDRADFPVLHELAPELKGVDRDREYELGLESTLDAIELRLRGKRPMP